MTNIIALPGGGTNNHSALINLGADDHAQYLIKTPTTTARNVIQPSAGTVTLVTLRGAVGQSAALLEAQDSAAAVGASLDASFRLGIGASPLSSAQAYVLSGNAARTPLVLRMAAGATANGFELQNNAGTALISATATGALGLNITAPASRLHVGGNALIGLVAARTTSTGVYAPDTATAEINSGVAVSGNTGYADLVMVTNQSGTANLLGRVVFVNQSLPQSDKRLAQIEAITEGATSLGALAFRTGGPVSLPEQMRVTNAGLVGVGTSTPLSRLHVNQIDSGTGNIVTMLDIERQSSAIPVNGFGLRLRFLGESSTTATLPMAYINVTWANATHGSRSSDVAVIAFNGITEREGLRIRGGAAGAELGFYGVTPVARPTVTGSRGGNAALASLLTALASQGIIIDSTTA